MKEKKEIFCFLGIGLFFLALILGVFAFTKQEKNVDSFNTLINQNVKQSKKAYLDVAGEPLVFAYYQNDENEFYFLYDTNGQYSVAKLSKETFEKLKEASLEHPIRVEGVTKVLPEDIKELGIASWNDILTSEEQISLDDFASYFGSIYLDEDGYLFEGNLFALIFAIFLGLLGFLALFYGFFQKS